jgi:hypothetical protein
LNEKEVATGQTVVKEVTTSVTQTALGVAVVVWLPLAATTAAKAEAAAMVENCILTVWSLVLSYYKSDW